MADTCTIDEYDIRTMIIEFVNMKVDELETRIEKKYADLNKEAKDEGEIDKLDILYEVELSEIYSIIAKEIDSSFTEPVPTEMMLVQLIVYAKLQLYRENPIPLTEQFIREKMNLDDGDIVLLGDGYRNEKLMFWSVKKGLIYPDFKSNDYGTVPSEFRVGNGVEEFSPWHWLNTMEHYDGTLWLSDSFHEEILSSLKEVASASLPADLSDLLRLLDTSKVSTLYHTTLMCEDEMIQVVSPVRHPTKFYAVDRHVIECSI
jgi:hypothetical protein